MIVSNIELELSFVDNTTKKVTIGPFNPSTLPELGSKFRQFFQTEHSWNANSFSSENGDALKNGTSFPNNTPISKVTIVTTEETEIDLTE